MPNFAKFFSRQIVGMFSEFKIALKSMPIGTHEFEYRLDGQFFKEMESADIHDASLTVNLTVNRKSDFYEMAFVINGEITLLCDRCLDEMALDVDTEYDIVVKYGDTYNDESDEVLIIPESDNYFNVAHLIYDTVSLEVPMTHVHDKGDCNEDMSEMLRQHSASETDDQQDEDDAPIDPRWSELKKLTENN